MKSGYPAGRRQPAAGPPCSIWAGQVLRQSRRASRRRRTSMPASHSPGRWEPVHAAPSPRPRRFPLHQVSWDPTSGLQGVRMALVAYVFSRRRRRPCKRPRRGRTRASPSTGSIRGLANPLLALGTNAGGEDGLRCLAKVRLLLGNPGVCFRLALTLVKNCSNSNAFERLSATVRALLQGGKPSSPAPGYVVVFKMRILVGSGRGARPWGQAFKRRNAAAVRALH